LILFNGRAPDVAIRHIPEPEAWIAHRVIELSGDVETCERRPWDIEPERAAERSRGTINRATQWKTPRPFLSRSALPRAVEGYHEYIFSEFPPENVSHPVHEALHASLAREFRLIIARESVIASCINKNPAARFLDIIEDLLRHECVICLAKRQ
jgi:hypothetical protein